MHWSLLTVETEVIVDSKCAKERCKRKGFFLGWFAGLVVPIQEIFVLPWLLIVGPVQNIVFLIARYFNFFVPIAQQPWQVAVLSRLSSSMCLWVR
jgi:hypothetical protein